jgi:hypothetical protein
VPDLVPTPEVIERAGDALLEAVLAARWGAGHSWKVGDLVVEWTSGRLDWERVGYLVAAPVEKTERVPMGERVFYIWSVAGRLTRWANAGISRLGPHGTRIRSIPYPSDDEIAAEFAANGWR